MDYPKINEETIKQAQLKLASLIESYNNSLAQFQVASLSLHMPMEHFNEIEKRIKKYYELIKNFI